MGQLVDKEEVLNLFNDLLPWDKEEVRDVIGLDQWKFTEEEILSRFKIRPLDHASAGECVLEYGRELFDYFADYEIFDEGLNRVYRAEPCVLIDMLSAKYEFGPKCQKWFTANDVDKLEGLIKKIREKLNNKSEKA